MKPISRILIALSALAMIATLYLPLWQIQLWAPQYPEGLNMKIWHNHLSGAFDIINGLNHYIGMRLIKEEMFPELHYIGILIGIYVAIGIAAALLNKISLLKLYVFTGIAYGAAAIYDFYRWGYDYGHNLDTHAAIQVPGMSYQPPVIGYKNLLNFTAYSGPDTGGWIIVVASIVAMSVLLYTLWTNKKSNPHKTTVLKKGMSLALWASVITLNACSTSGPASFRLGLDECAHCKMMITDPKFGVEIITKTNKVFKFDDAICFNNYVKEHAEISSQTRDIYFVDYAVEGGFIPLENALFLQSDEIKSPMGSSLAVFSQEAQLKEISSLYTVSKKLTWDEASKIY